MTGGGVWQPMNPPSVPLRSFRPDENQTTLSLIREGKEESLTFGKDFIPDGDPTQNDTAVNASILYVGYRNDT